MAAKGLWVMVAAKGLWVTVAAKGLWVTVAVLLFGTDVDLPIQSFK